ncbi:DUF1684 domain-containing protein [bacterium]|nr:DUF1684 domain-containing protein [bacterium]
MKLILSLLLIAIALGSCRSSDVEPSDIVAEIKKQRLAKDRYFTESSNSPLPDKLKGDFSSLHYFPVDLKYRFRVRLIEYDDRHRFRIITSTGVDREAEKVGYFRFEMQGKICSLQVYKLVDIQKKFPNYLFVPFRDATTGKESYGGGRYLDLQITDSGLYDLDFNLAYNPSCAYGKAGYNCPIPPEENRLDVAIRAGERYDPELYR